MKKIFLIATATAVMVTGFAQAANDVSLNTRTSVNKSSVTSGRSSSASTKTINAKAIKHFNANYKNASDVQWSVLKDGFMTMFTNQGNVSRVYYDKSGNWKFSVKYYGESKLPKDVRAQVKSTYYDFVIKSVQEITFADKTVYMVDIEGNNTTKELRICDGEMEIIHDFPKL